MTEQNTTGQPMLPEVSVEALLTLIGELTVTTHRQGALIQHQAARLAELEEGAAGPVPIAAGDGRD